MKRNRCSTLTGSEIALSWPPMRLKILHWWPDIHNWSPAGDWLFQATIIIQTITLIFSQIDPNKIQSRRPSGHLLFTFPLLFKYKNDFPLIIIYWQRFTAMISAKLHHHVSSAVSHNIRIAYGSGHWVEKCCTVVVWCEQHGEHRAKNQTGTRESIKLTSNIWQPHKTAKMASIRFVQHVFF